MLADFSVYQILLPAALHPGQKSKPNIAAGIVYIIIRDITVAGRWFEAVR